MKSRRIGKKELYSNATKTERDVEYLLTNRDELLPETFGSIEPVTLSRIKLDPDQPRKLQLDPDSPGDIKDTDPQAKQKHLELDEIRQLADSIKEHGLLQEPGVYRRGENFMLAWGERRVLACRLLNYETIHVKILPERPSALRAKQLVENIQRRDLSLRERLGGLQALSEESESGSSASDLQHLLGISQSAAYRYHALLKAPQDVKDAIEAGDLSDIKLAATIACIKDPAERQRALENLHAPDMPIAIPATPAPEPAKVKSVGRPMTTINLGKTSSGDVARHIAEKLVSPADFAKNYASANWKDLKVASDLLKQIIKSLEKRLLEKR